MERRDSRRRHVEERGARARRPSRRTLHLQRNSILRLFLLFASSSAIAAVELPRPSPAASVFEKIGTAKLTVTYSRPAVKGREIWGGLVPYGQVWRLGANDATTLEISENAKVAGHDLPPGAYALFAIPSKDKWTIVVNSEAKQWGAYFRDPKKDLFSFDVVPISRTAPGVDGIPDAPGVGARREGRNGVGEAPDRVPRRGRRERNRLEEPRHRARRGGTGGLRRLLPVRALRARDGRAPGRGDGLARRRDEAREELLDGRAQGRPPRRRGQVRGGGAASRARDRGLEKGGRARGVARRRAEEARGVGRRKAKKG